MAKSGLAWAQENLKIISSPLSIIKNNNGDVMHAIKNTDNGFNNFGEAYFTLDFFKFNQSMEETFKNDNEFSRTYWRS